MQRIMKVWTILNGRKTSIGFVLCGLSDLLTGVLVDIWHVEGFHLAEIAKTLNMIGWSFGGVGAGHKLLKTFGPKPTATEGES